jgi:hypothetical protein
LEHVRLCRPMCGKAAPFRYRKPRENARGNAARA